MSRDNRACHLSAAPSGVHAGISWEGLVQWQEPPWSPQMPQSPQQSCWVPGAARLGQRGGRSTEQGRSPGPADVPAPGDHRRPSQPSLRPRGDVGAVASCGEGGSPLQGYTEARKGPSGHPVSPKCTRPPLSWKQGDRTQKYTRGRQGGPRSGVTHVLMKGHVDTETDMRGATRMWPQPQGPGEGPARGEAARRAWSRSAASGAMREDTAGGEAARLRGPRPRVPPQGGPGPEWSRLQAERGPCETPGPGPVCSRASGSLLRRALRAHFQTENEKVAKCISNFN